MTKIQGFPSSFSEQCELCIWMSFTLLVTWHYLSLGEVALVALQLQLWKLSASETIFASTVCVFVSNTIYKLVWTQAILALPEVCKEAITEM